MDTEENSDGVQADKEIVSHAEMRAMLWGRQRQSSSEYPSYSKEETNSSHRPSRPMSLSDEWKELKRLRSCDSICRSPASEKNLNLQSRRSIWKNFISLCCGLMFAFMSFLPLRNIQTSLHEENHLGTISLAAIYIGFIIGCIISPWLVQNARPKGLILLAMSSHVLYVAANLLPSFFTLVPASCLFGFLQAPLWSVQELLIGSYGTSYSSVVGIRIDKSIRQFQSVFVIFCHSAQIFGNLLESAILNMNETYSKPHSDLSLHTKLQYNTHHRSGISNGSTCPNSSNCVLRPTYEHLFSENIKAGRTEAVAEPDWLEILKFIFLAMACLSVTAIGCCLRKPDIIINKRKMAFKDKVCAVLKFFRTKTFVMLGLIMIFTGMQQGIVISDVTKIYGTQTLGLSMIGYLMMCYGTAQLAMLLILEKIQTKVKPVAFVLKGFLITQGLLILLLIWEPHEDSLYTILGCMALWGAVDAIWQSQIQTILIQAADKKEPAVISFRVCQGLGLCVVFLASIWLTLLYKVCLIGAVLVLGVIGYMVMEVSNNPITPSDTPPFNV